MIATTWSLEELGATAHPGWCRRPHEGDHRSDPIPVGGRTIRAFADERWTVWIAETGDGPLTADEQTHLAAIVAHLQDPAGTGVQS